MKVVLISTILTIFIYSETIANEYRQYLPKSFEGYIVYEALGNDGRKSVVRMPVRYVLSPEERIYNNEENNRSLDYQLELDRSYKNQSWREKPITEDEKINIAAYYPLYFD